MAPQYENLYHRLMCLAPAFDPNDPDECWEHEGNLNRPGGYPRVSVRRGGKHTKEYAHRLMYTIVHGPIPEGHEVDHKCHNHRCIRPTHLQALPLRDNRAKNKWRGL